jgi:hypothetical protein
MPAAPARATVTRRLAITDIARAILELPEGVGSKMDVVQHATVLVAMTACQENQSAAARMLGMERKAFARKLSRARRPTKTTQFEAPLRSRPRTVPSEASLRSGVRPRRDLAASTRRAG